jgi:adenine/guanine/hypoxanthine permease
VDASEPAGAGAKEAHVATTVAPAEGLDRYFKISERGSSVRTEIIAGLATWLTMAYILFVNPAILGSIPDHTGTTLPFDQVLTVTALAAGVMTILMGVVANYPFALAAGLGLNAFVAFTLVGTFGLTWPEAMGVIVIEGLIIAALVLTGFREAVLNAIPMDLKRAIGIGIGLFIAFIGLVNAGIVVHPEAGTIVTLNPDLSTLRILTFALGLAVTAALVARRMRGALLIGILFTTVLAIVINEIWGHSAIWTAVGPGVAQVPDKVVSTPHFDLLGNFSITGVFDVVPFLTAVALILSVMLSDFFDTMGTVIGIGGEARLLDDRGRLPGINRVLFIDSLAAAAGGAASASSNTTYIESAAGVSEGGRTGLTAVVVGVLFLLAIFLSPLAGVIPPEATAPVLVIVGYFMMTMVREIDWADASIGIPALLTMIVMPFTFSITNGVGAGFISYVVIQVLRGRWDKVHWLLYLVSVIFVWYFVRGLLA